MLSSLLSLPSGLMGSLVLARLELPDIVRLDTAILVRECRSDLLDWYLVAPPFCLNGYVHNKNLRWLFRRNVRVGRFLLDWNEQLFQLIEQNIDLLTDGIVLDVDYCGQKAISRWDESKVPSAVLSKIDELKINSTARDQHLPFRLLRSLHYKITGPSDGLASLVRNNPMLKELTVYGQFQQSFGFAAALTEESRMLTMLTLCGDGITSAELQHFAACCPLLTTLVLKLPELVVKAGAMAFLHLCPLLESATLYSFGSPVDLSLVLSRGLNLKHIDISPWPQLSDAVLAARNPASAPLRQLTFCWGAVSLEAIAAGGAFLSGIRELSLPGYRDRSYDTLVAGLRAMPELRALRLSVVHPDVFVAVVQGCTQITKLTIGDPLRDEDVTRLVNIVHSNPGLVEFNVSALRVRGADAVVLALAESCADLRAVSLPGALYLTDASVTEMARGCPKLMMLKLGDCCQLTDASVYALAEHCRELDRLYLPRCVKVTSTAMEHLLRSCSCLRRISLPAESLPTATCMQWRAQTPRLHIARISWISSGSSADVEYF